MSSLRLTLLSTDACTLCDTAFELLASMPELRGLELDVVDIAEDQRLMAEYAEQIPVLALRSAGGEIAATLVWPFDDQSVSRWLRKSEQ